MFWNSMELCCYIFASSGRCKNGQLPNICTRRIQGITDARKKKIQIKPKQNMMVIMMVSLKFTFSQYGTTFFCSPLNVHF